MAKQRCDPREIDMRSRRPRRDRMRLPRRPTLRAGSTCRLSCVSRALRGGGGKEDPLLVVESTVSPEATMPAVPAMGTPIPVRPARPEVHCSPRRRPLLPPPRLPPPPRPTSRLQRPSPARWTRSRLRTSPRRPPPTRRPTWPSRRASEALDLPRSEGGRRRPPPLPLHLYRSG